MLDDVQNNRAAAWYTGTRGVILAIQRQPGTNTVAVADAVRETMTQLQKQIPATINMTLMYDKSRVDSRVGHRREVHAAADARASSSR